MPRASGSLTHFDTAYCTNSIAEYLAKPIERLLLNAVGRKRSRPTSLLNVPILLIGPVPKRFSIYPNILSIYPFIYYIILFIVVNI